MMNNNDEPKIYSYHTFMFPFRWSIKSKEIFETQIDINEFCKICKDNNWTELQFNINSHEDYNEYSYFHDFAQRALFNTKSTNSDKKNDEFPSYYFEKNTFDEKSFEVDILCKNWEDRIVHEKKYTLNIDGVSLRVFETGIAILSINLQNYNHRTFEDTLFINDFARRLYPQYLSKNKNPENEDLADSAKNSFLPRRIKFANLEDELFIYKNPHEPKISNYIYEILGKSFSKHVDVKQLLDDRMFVISHVLDNAKSIDITRCYQKNIDWYKYLFVDSKDLTCQNSELREHLLNTHTYARWQDYGTLWGISRYSFVCISDNSDFSHKVINQHIRRHYFQMISLALAIRTSIIRFSDEISKISNIPKGQENLQEKISFLYHAYIKFVNRIYFREISPQEQGIELYNHICESMNIHKDVKDLDGEIAELHTYSSLLNENVRNDKLSKLSTVATYLMPPTLVIGFFGMNTFDEKFFSSPIIEQLDANLGWTLLTLVLAIVSVIITNRLLTR